MTGEHSDTQTGTPSPEHLGYERVSEETTPNPEDGGKEKRPAGMPPGMGYEVPSAAVLKDLTALPLVERLRALPAEAQGPYLDSLMKELQKEQDANLRDWAQAQIRAAVEQSVHEAVERLGAAIKLDANTVVQKALDAAITKEAPALKPDARAIGEVVERVASSVQSVLLKLGEQGTQAVVELVNRVTPTVLAVNERNNTVDRPDLAYIAGVVKLAKDHHVCLTVGDIEVCLREEPPPPKPTRSRRKTAE